MRVARSVSPANTGSLVPVGAMLGTLSIAALIAILHHPVAHGGNAVALFTSIRRQAGLDQSVHGALAAIFGLLTTGMFLFASRLGVYRYAVLLGLICYCCGAMMMELAVMTDGFIAPAIVEHCPPTSASCAPSALIQLSYGAMQIEYLTRFALVAIGVAILSWAVALLLDVAAPRWSGLLGLVAGGVQLAALFATSGRLTPHSLMFVMAGQIAWYAVVATLMVAKSPPFEPAVAGSLP